MATTQQIIQGNLQVLGFVNTSATAIYNQIAIAVGQVVDNTINEINNSETTITNILISQYGYGKPLYYTSNALGFQYGDNLIINTAINPVTGAPYLNFIYATPDPTLQIVNQAAFEELVTGANSQLFLKIATLNTVTGLLEPLTSPELSSFTSYFLNFQIPGLPISIINNPGNILNFNWVCTYFSAYDLTTLTTNVQNAFISFQDAFAFDGVFFDGDLSDYIKTNVPGIRDFYINNTTLDGIPFQGSAVLTSGYFNYISTINANGTFNPVTS